MITVIEPPKLLEMSPDDLTSIVQMYVKQYPHLVPEGYEVDYMANIELREAAVIGRNTGSLVGTLTFTLKKKA